MPGGTTTVSPRLAAASTAAWMAAASSVTPSPVAPYAVTTIATPAAPEEPAGPTGPRAPAGPTRPASPVAPAGPGGEGAPPDEPLVLPESASQQTPLREGLERATARAATACMQRLVSTETRVAVHMRTNGEE